MPATPHTLPALHSSRPLRVLRALVVLALAAAALVGPGLFTPHQAEAATRSPAGSALRYAMYQMGDPYRWGATGPNAFDCSGLTQRAYRFAGVSIPRVSRQQWSAGRKIARSNWKPGDLVFWANNRSRPSSSIYHVAIYVGGGRVLHAPRTGQPVQISAIWSYDLMPQAVRPGHGAALLPVKPGATGDRVNVVQRRLRANGFGLNATGRYGSRTKHAVAAFQRRVGYRSTGNVGPATWARLVQRGVMKRVV
ncbi:MAG: NlpC/P60 family protein [Actinomycetes bacterium]